MHPADPDELLHLIALTMVHGVGPKSARAFLKHYGSAKKIFGTDPEELGKLGDKGGKMAAAAASSSFRQAAEKEMDFILRHNVRCHFFMDDAYPALLKECDDAPILLYAVGKNELQAERCLAVVGTRKASSYGKDVCRDIIRELSVLAPGTLIISGLAYGIDIIAHRAAMEFGLPTIAVLGHGLNTIYPSSHRDDAKKILGHGALVSDFHTRMGPERNNFLRRNRIIAGLSQATLVVESPRKGGALITADLAHSYHRDVLAVPGRVNDPTSSGCNKLIALNTAAMVRNARDLLRVLNWDTGRHSLKKAAPAIRMNPLESEIMRIIREQEGAVPETIGRSCGMDIPQVLVCLLDMELKGWIESEAGNRYRALLPMPGSG